MMSASLSAGLPAQTVPSSEDFSIWLRTDNPVSIGINTMPDLGHTALGAKSVSGDFHKAMESGVGKFQVQSGTS